MRHYPPRKTGGMGRSHRNRASHLRFMRAVKKRDGYRCVECGSTTDLRACHIIPLHQGGTDDLSNGVTRCGDCDKRTDPYAR